MEIARLVKIAKEHVVEQLNRTHAAYAEGTTVHAQDAQTHQRPILIHRPLWTTGHVSCQSVWVTSTTTF